MIREEARIILYLTIISVGSCHRGNGIGRKRDIKTFVKVIYRINYKSFTVLL